MPPAEQRTRGKNRSAVFVASTLSPICTALLILVAKPRRVNAVRCRSFASAAGLLLTSCADLDPHKIDGWTTFEPSEHTTLSFICHQDTKSNGKTSVHCDRKKDLIQFGYKF